MKETLFAAMVASVAMVATPIFAQKVGAAQGSFAIFPPNSMVQCAINGKAIEGFSTVTALKDKFGAGGALAGQAINSPFKDKISFYAFAVVESDATGIAVKEEGDDDDDGDFEVAMYAGLSENVTFGEFRDEVLEMLSKRTDEDDKPVGHKTENLDGGGVRVILPKGGLYGDEGGPSAFCLFPASPSLVVVAEKEEIVRSISNAISNGKAIAPTIPDGNILAWLSASINPKEFLGADDEDEDGDEDEWSSPFGSMEFLSEMTNIMVVVEGKDDSGAVHLSALTRFASATGASAAAGMLSGMLQMAAFSGDASNPLVALGKRSKVAATGGECRLTAVFPNNEIEAFFATMAVETEER